MRTIFSKKSRKIVSHPFFNKRLIYNTRYILASKHFWIFNISAVLRILDVYLGSLIQIFPFWIPESGSKRFRFGSASKNLSVFNPKTCFQALGNMIRDVLSYPGSWIPDLIFFHPGSWVRIPNPGVKKALDPGWIRIRNAVFLYQENQPICLVKVTSSVETSVAGVDL